MPAQHSDLSPRRVLAFIRRRAPIVVVCVLIAAAASILYSKEAEKKYTATASLVFNNTPLSQQIAGLAPVVNTNPQGQQDTNIQLLKLGDLASKTAQQVGHGLTSQAVLDSVSVSPTGDTTVVTVSSTLPAPALAAQVANVYSATFVNEQANANHRYYASALATVERQLSQLSPGEARGAQGLALQNRAQSLATLAQLRTGTVSLAQSAAIPTAASSPRTKRDAIVAALLGLLLGLGLALLIERFDQNIREPEELEVAYGLPLLGAVPQNSALRRSGRVRRPDEPSSAVADTFQFVRARLRYFNVDRDLTTLAVVSAQPGDGKTTIAHWLAYAAAGMGSRVLLIETDLRRPTMAQELGLESAPGLADILIGVRSFEDAKQVVQLDGAHTAGEGIRALEVIVAGALPPNPAEMLESHAMADLLRLAKSKYDLVILDTAPLGAVSDALPLMANVDGVAIVAGMSRNRRDSARRLKATLESVDAPLLGVIANRVKARSTGRYGYGYSYESKAAVQGGEAGSESAYFVPAETIRSDSSAEEAASERAGARSLPPSGSSGSGVTNSIGNAPRVQEETGSHLRQAEGNGPVESASNANGSGRSSSLEGSGAFNRGVVPTAVRQRSAASASPSEPDRVLIYRLGSIGDTVAALPCFHLIELAYPQSERVVLTNFPASSKAAPLDDVLQPGGFIHRAIPYPLGMRNPGQVRRLAKEVRDQRFRTLIYLAASRGLTSVLRDVAFFRLCGIEEIIGAPVSDDLQANRVDPEGNLERESERLARTLTGLGTINLEDRAWWDLRLTDGEYSAADCGLARLANTRFLAVNTGGKAPEKDWGIEAWRLLLARLGAELTDWGLVFVGGPEDKDRAARLGTSWPGTWIDLCGQLTPRESAAALARAALFIGHDSGAVHLADAVGTPAVGLFGNYNKPRMWHPGGPETRIIHRMAGMSAITREEVADTALELIGSLERR